MDLPWSPEANHSAVKQSRGQGLLRGKTSLHEEILQRSCRGENKKQTKLFQGYACEFREDGRTAMCRQSLAFLELSADATRLPHIAIGASAVQVTILPSCTQAYADVLRRGPWPSAIATARSEQPSSDSVAAHLVHVARPKHLIRGRATKMLGIAMSALL